MSAFAVLHVTSIPGGGVDRHIRDIARADPRAHLVWHAAERADAIEIVDEHRVLPLEPAAVDREPRELVDWLRARRVGLVHAHAVTEAPRARAAWIARELGVPLFVTLHDVLFLRRAAFDERGTPIPDPAWLAGTAAFISRAAAVLAPSEYLANIARAHLPGVTVHVVPNGSGVTFSDAPVPTHPDYGKSRFRHVAVVLGAVGPHKGARMLERVAEELAGSDIGIVVIGYMDERNLPGWHRDHLFVHGTYQDAEVASLARAYGARVGLFTNQVPESFSYALSDLWAAGLPVIVPPAGALGDRVRAHGAGWVLPADFSAHDVAGLLRRLFSAEGAAELARVESELDRPDPERIPSLDAMTRSLDPLYARFGLPPPKQPLDAGSPDLQRLLATSLDGSLFRSEMIRFADEIDQLRRGLDHERAEYARVSGEMKQWIGKLESDVAALKEELVREAAARTEAQTTLFEARQELRRCQAELESIPMLLRRVLRRKLPDASD